MLESIENFPSTYKYIHREIVLYWKNVFEEKKLSSKVNEQKVNMYKFCKYRKYTNICRAKSKSWKIQYKKKEKIQKNKEKLKKK